MKDLKTQYKEAKEKAVNLMQKGNVTAHIAALVRVQELHLQLINKNLFAGQ